MGRLDDKVAIITGGAGGIGRVTGKRFVDEGAKVLLVDVAEDKLKEAAAEISSENVAYIEADVSKSEDVKKYVQKAVNQFGGIDILIDNAGIEGDVVPLTDYDEDDFDAIMNVNVRGMWLGLKYTVPEMIERGGGSVVMTSSVAGMQGFEGLGPYVTSKHAVVGMMRTAAIELAGENIRVNTVNPAPIETRMMRSIEEETAEEQDEAKQMFEGMIPMGRYGKTEEVADVMLYLASNQSRYVTGAVHAVDGGLTA